MLADPMLECQLPRKNALSGLVLRHAVSVVEKTATEKGPLVLSVQVWVDTLP